MGMAYLGVHPRALLLSALLVGVGGTAAAQDAPTAAVLKPVPGPETEPALVGAVERVLRARLDAIAPIEVSGTPDLELSDLQLATGCSSENDDCLSAIAEQLGVQGVVLTHVDRTGGAIVVSIVWLDARDSERREATSRGSGEHAENEAIEGIDGAVRELFGLPVARESRPGEYGNGGSRPPPPTRTPESGGIGAVPLLVTGAGVAALGVGAVFAFMSSASESDYADAPTDTTEQVDAALDLKSDAESQAHLANVLFAVGGGLVAIGATLLVLDLGGGEAEVTASGAVGPDAAGITIRGNL